MASSNKAGFNLRENFPLPRNIPSLIVRGGTQSQAPRRIHKLWREATSRYTTEPNTHEYTGQRTSLLGYRDWLRDSTSPKDWVGYLVYPAHVRDSAKRGLGCIDNRRLSHPAEFTPVNVGGPYRDAKASSLPIPDRSVGGLIVVRGRESLLHGEGDQGINVSRLESNSESDEFRTYRKERL